MTIEVRDGVTVIEGEPEALVTADYPYYRDDPAVWADRLRAIRDDLGIHVISCYLPWRHHQPTPDGPPDFSGQTHPSRDVVGFLSLCHELGLRVIAKPGPFIHAETNYGGLPDWVCPRTNPAIEPLLDARGEMSAWLGEPLPAPLGPVFDPLVTQWLAATGKEVLEAATWPEGPVILMQIANEGIFTSGALPLSAYDYSASGLGFFRSRLQAWYGTPQEYNRVHGTAIADWQEIQPPREWRAPARSEEQQGYADWGRFHAEYLAEVYHRWAAAVNCRVPVVVNLNPPAEHHHSFDDWLARVRPELWDGIHYGFTNWMGVVSANPDSQARYVLAAKRAPGPNLEENWGFSELYDPAYADATTSFHQSLLAMAAGATGFNVYTGVGTSGWLEGLDSVHDSPYPDSAPIAEDGTVTPKAHAVRSLADFLAQHGAEFLECVPETSASYGLYLPYAGIAAWSGPGDGPQLGRSLRAFHDRMRAAGRDYQVVELESATDLSAHPRLTVPGGVFMHRQVQRLLAAHIEAGNQVEVDGPAPVLDEFLRPCRILAEALTGASCDLPEPRVRVVDGHADAFLRTHPERDVTYLTVLTMSDHEGAVLVELDGRPIELITARGGAAIVRLVGGELDDFLVKGVNGFLDSAVPAGVKVGAEILIADHPADLDRIGGEFRIR
ncbi:beta-galactosidase [Acrocarpospora sp. B8E8]|uniref:beta-galactosidase n=1 Tax=Acrocarpospora sp. B8E8 TaxID=3153572 RepID=UPI00325F20A0